MKKLTKKIENKLFKNPGKEIKSLAIISYILEVIGAIVAFIIIAIDDYNAVWLLCIPAAFIVGYLPNLLLYSYGSVVENTEKIANSTKEKRSDVDTYELPII